MKNDDIITYPRQVSAPENSPATIGERIRHARKGLDLNQDALAARLGVTQPTVANWEADVHNPRQLMLAKLAEALEVSLAWLASGDEVERTLTMARSGYVARAIYHAPVIPAHRLSVDTALTETFLQDAAVDYIPISARSGIHYAVFLDPGPFAASFPGETLFVFDAARCAPSSGGFALIIADNTPPRLHRWPTAPAEHETCLGTLAFTVRFF